MKSPFFLIVLLLMVITKIMAGFIGLVLLIMTCIGLWHMFEKAGEDGWRCLVPFYNVYIIGEICGKEKLSKIIIAIDLVTILVFPAVEYEFIRTSNNLFFKDDMTSAVVIGGALAILLAFVSIVLKTILKIILDYYFIKSYGAHTAFLLLAIFLPSIAWMILGLSAKYPYYGIYNPHYVNSYWRTGKI